MKANQWNNDGENNESESVISTKWNDERNENDRILMKWNNNNES